MVVKNREFFNYLQVRLCQLRLAAQMCLTFARYEESAALRIDQVHEDEGNLIVLFAKGKSFQYGEIRMSVIMGDSTLVINPVHVITMYISRLEGVAGNKGVSCFQPSRHPSMVTSVWTNRPRTSRC